MVMEPKNGTDNAVIMEFKVRDSGGGLLQAAKKYRLTCLQMPNVPKNPKPQFLLHGINSP